MLCVGALWLPNPSTWAYSFLNKNIFLFIFHFMQLENFLRMKGIIDSDKKKQKHQYYLSLLLNKRLAYVI